MLFNPNLKNKYPNIWIKRKRKIKKTMNKLKGKVKTYKEIVPFDYDHKCVLEPNKEFSGFVQQFIAIEEMYKNKDNANMIIKDVSMNYLYVSHPIFVIHKILMD